MCLYGLYRAGAIAVSDRAQNLLSTGLGNTIECKSKRNGKL